VHHTLADNSNSCHRCTLQNFSIGQKIIRKDVTIFSQY
jgi:hypothetical protein